MTAFRAMELMSTRLTVIKSKRATSEVAAPEGGRVRTNWVKVAKSSGARLGLHGGTASGLMKRPGTQPKTAISLRVDNDVLAFFKANGPGYQSRMNAVLRDFMKSQSDA